LLCAEKYEVLNDELGLLFDYFFFKGGKFQKQRALIDQRQLNATLPIQICHISLY